MSGFVWSKQWSPPPGDQYCFCCFHMKKFRPGHHKPKYALVCHVHNTRADTCAQIATTSSKRNCNTSAPITTITKLQTPPHHFSTSGDACSHHHIIFQQAGSCTPPPCSNQKVRLRTFLPRPGTYSRLSAGRFPPAWHLFTIKRREVSPGPDVVTWPGPARFWRSYKKTRCPFFGMLPCGRPRP